LTLLGSSAYIEDEIGPNCMQITRAGEYGVLGLIHLARRAPGEMAMIEEVSQSERIPKSFLAKIFQHLGKAGFVRSVRGAGGGFVLARDASEITVLAIIEAIEGKIVFQRCLQEEPECEHLGGCALCGLLEQAQDGMREVLMRTTLKDLIDRQDKMEARGLRMPGVPAIAGLPGASKL
jgi:Rrf2 family transcriptional regulator, iron-sulfur cluster assembly transcription factor